MSELSSQEIESSSQKEQGRFESCVILGLESMASELVGQNIKMENRETLLREKQTKRYKFLNQEKLNKELADKSGIMGSSSDTFKTYSHVIKMEKLKSRLDLFNIKSLLEQLKDSDSKIGEVLKNTEIRYEKGGLDEAKKYLSEDYQVGVVIRIPNSILTSDDHFFHLGKDEDGTIIDKSDRDELKLQVQEWITGNEISFLMKNHQKNSQSWGLLLMKNNNNDLN